MRNNIIGSVLLLAVACQNAPETKPQNSIKETTVVVDAIEQPQQAKYGKTKLSDYNFFTGEIKDLKPAKGVFAYEVNAPLFTDYASKKRFIYLPENTKMTFHPTEALGFPDRAIIIKNFYYTAAQTGTEQRIMETRLLLKENGAWHALPYIWNNQQTEAYLDVTGGKRSVSLTNHGQFEYVVPNFKQCKNCHDYKGKFTPIGPNARQLNDGKRLAQWVADGILEPFEADQVDALADYHNTQIDLNLRARGYLDGNCSYCHRPGGSAKNSGLDLRLYSPTEFSLGILKGPVAAGKGSGGLAYDIVPGQHHNSILHYRMNSTDPAVMMPELGRSLIHEEGVQLIAEWITNMKSE